MTITSVPAYPAAQASALVTKAKEASEHAYAPYSGFHVGAAAKLTDGTVVTGANVENVSYGLTQCAERNLLNTVVAMGYKPPLPVEALAVWGALKKTADKAAAAYGAVTPCGACRQALVELLPGNTPVIYKQPKTGDITTTTPHALLPASFNLDA